MGITFYIHRYFDWTRAVLWPHQIPFFGDPERFLVTFGGKDSILSAPRVRQYLLRQGMKDAFPSEQGISTFGTRPQSGSIQKSGNEDTNLGVFYDWQKPTELDIQEPLHISKIPSTQKSEGGILYDPEAGHGQTFMPDNLYFAMIKGWVEGQGLTR